MTYTEASGLAVALAVVADVWVLRTALVRRRVFWVSYAIVVAFQLAVNGVLTGLGIVRYDRQRIVGWRIAWAPVEDLGFGFALVLCALTTWVWLGRRGVG
jgi:lycopene cyclase domain-containing protein